MLTFAQSTNSFDRNPDQAAAQGRAGTVLLTRLNDIGVLEGMDRLAKQAEQLRQAGGPIGTLPLVMEMSTLANAMAKDMRQARIPAVTSGLPQSDLPGCTDLRPFVISSFSSYDMGWENVTAAFRENGRLIQVSLHGHRLASEKTPTFHLSFGQGNEKTEYAFHGREVVAELI